MGIETLEQTKEHWQVYKSPEAAFITDSFQCEDNRWTSFSALPLVIMYNTNVVTYRELPVGWNSLLEPRWKGRIAFVDPRRSDVFGCPCDGCPYMGKKGGLPGTVYGKSGIRHPGQHAGGECRYPGWAGIPLGVTMEESAQALLSEGPTWIISIPRRDHGPSGRYSHCKGMLES